MKIFVLTACVIALTLAQPSVVYQTTLTTNELWSSFPSNDSQYQILSFDPGFFSDAMDNYFQYYSNSSFVDPDSQFQQLGCNRKLHITETGNIYCVDTNSNYFYQLSIEPPYEIINSWWLGYSDSNYYDWSDPATQYMNFVEPSTDVSENWNFTIFDFNTGTWVDSFHVNFAEVISDGYDIEGYFVTPTFIGFGINSNNGSAPGQVWVHPYGTQNFSRLAWLPQNNIQRSITIGFTTYICISGNQINAVSLSTGQVNTMNFSDTVNAIDRTDLWHFTAQVGESLYLLTVNSQSEIQIVSQNDNLGPYMNLNNVSIAAPICCPQYGVFQTWITKPEQDSYLVLNSTTLEILDYNTPYPVSESGTNNFPTLVWSNQTTVALDMGGYSLHTTSNEFLAYVNLPFQDAYVDLTSNLAYGFYTGNSNIYPGTQCYLATFDASDVSVENFSDCPNQSGSDVTLLDVQSDGLTYQNNASQFVVLQGGNSYTINSLIAKFGNSLAFAQYSQNTLYLVDQVGLNQLVLETYTINTGSKVGTSVLSVSGQASKAGEDAVLYTANQLNGTVVVKVYNFTTQSTPFSTTVNTPVTSIVATSLNSNGLESFVWVDNNFNLWINFNGNVNQIEYEFLGNVMVQSSGNGLFTVSTWNTGVQINTVYSV